jgi:hypothetical protein
MKQASLASSMSHGGGKRRADGIHLSLFDPASLANAIPHREGALLTLRYQAASVAHIVQAANAASRHDDIHRAIAHAVDPLCGIAGVVRPYFRCPRRGLLGGRAHAGEHLLLAQADHFVRRFVRNLRTLKRTACNSNCADQRQRFDAPLNVHRVAIFSITVTFEPWGAASMSHPIVTAIIVVVAINLAGVAFLLVTRRMNARIAAWAAIAVFIFLMWIGYWALVEHVRALLALYVLSGSLGISALVFLGMK